MFEVMQNVDKGPKYGILATKKRENNLVTLWLNFYKIIKKMILLDSGNNCIMLYPLLEATLKTPVITFLSFSFPIIFLYSFCL